MFKRFFLVMRSWLGADIENLEDPDLLLQQAQEEMRSMHAKNRERAVQAITEKNRLEKACKHNDDLQERLYAARIAVENAKREIRREDEHIREKTRQALRLKAQWLDSQRNFGYPPLPRPRLDARTIVLLLIAVDAALLALLGLSFRH